MTDRRPSQYLSVASETFPVSKALEPVESLEPSELLLTRLMVVPRLRMWRLLADVGNVGTVRDSRMLTKVRTLRSRSGRTLALLLGFNRVHTASNTNYGKVTVSVRSHAVYSLS